MTDPRDIAHDKKVRQEKKKRREELAPSADKNPRLGKKTTKQHHASDVRKVPDEPGPVPTGEQTAGVSAFERVDGLRRAVLGDCVAYGWN